MQPVQLSLLPEASPAPPPTLIPLLPGEHLSRALVLLGRLIAQAVQDAAAVGVGDE